MITEKSIKIPNKSEFTFDLELDDIIGIIRLTKHKSKADYIRITDRHIPILTCNKWEFHNQRSGYSEKINNNYNFIGSYIDRKISPINYQKWKQYIITSYKNFKQTYWYLNKETN